MAGQANEGGPSRSARPHIEPGHRAAGAVHSGLQKRTAQSTHHHQRVRQRWGNRVRLNKLISSNHREQ